MISPVPASSARTVAFVPDFRFGDLIHAPSNVLISPVPVLPVPYRKNTREPMERALVAPVPSLRISMRSRNRWEPLGTIGNLWG